ncbi:MAG: DapH/DapD/GlmU-related protein, partial [Anaerolineales bacterium]
MSAQIESISDSACIFEKVMLGHSAVIGEYVVVGAQPQPAAAEALETRIGPYAVIRSHAVIYAGNTIGARFHVGHGALVREKNTIGDDVSIGSHAVVEHHVVIADGVRIHSGAFVPEYSVLKAGCWIGPNAVLTNARYPLARNAKETLQGPVIEPRAIIGANATVLPGVVVGAGVLVGAGAVVTRDVPPGAVVVGNPARVIGTVAELDEYGGTNSAG